MKLNTTQIRCNWPKFVIKFFYRYVVVVISVKSINNMKNVGAVHMNSGM